MTLTLTSSAFADGGPIPARHTCEGPDRSPPLAWSGIPPKARSLTLIVDDPDAPDPAAPRMTWVHWVLYNIPVSAHGLAEAVPAGSLPPGTVEGITDFKRRGWGGPCPPIGRHRYYFKLYAVDLLLPATPGQTKAQVERAMAGHVLAETRLMGTYQKGDR
jgi:Raf kinase inhibitor-like YbhB/YbcL family protein